MSIQLNYVCYKIYPSISNATNSNGTTYDKNKTKSLQKAFIEKYVSYPKITNDEIKLLTDAGYSIYSARNLVWKPLYDAEGNIFLIADSSNKTEGAGSGPMIYYKGHYYLHQFTADKTVSITPVYIGEGTVGLQIKDGLPYDSKEQGNVWILVK